MIGGWRFAAVLALAAQAMGACLSGAPALAETRLALVIGNSSYRTVTALPNPVNDAKAIAEELKAAAFDVTLAPDLGQSDMRRAIRDFAAKIAEKGPDTIALVFYAGHGVQVDGENFLVPVDARIQREADIAIEAVRLADLMNALAGVPSKMRIVILDACRNNPFSPTKQTRGLAIVDAPTGSIVAYSTAPGTEATDGAGSNSPYTAAFLEVSQQPRLQIEQVFKQVRLKVHQATKGQQTPWESSSLTSDFWFLPSDSAAPAPSPAVAAVPPTAPASQVATRFPAQQPAAPPAQPPAQPPAPGVAAAPAAPAPRPAAPAASPISPPPAQAGYAAAPPPRVSQVASIRTLPADEAYELVIADDSVEAYEEYLFVYPDDPRADWVRTSLALRVDAIAWRYASAVNTPAAYEAYLSRYPGGVYADDAVRLRVRPRLRVLDAVIAPRVFVPPPEPRIALPLIQTRRPAGVPIVLPVVYSRPAPFNPAARLAPAQRLPVVAPAAAPRINAVTATPSQTPKQTPSQLPRPALAPLPGTPRPNAITTAPSQAAVPQNKLSNPNAVAPLRPNTAINAAPAPTAAPYRPAGPAVQQPPVANVAPHLPPAQPTARPVNPQVRPPPQRAQVAGPNPKPAPAKCTGKQCKR